MTESSFPIRMVRIMYWALLVGPFVIATALWFALGGRVVIPGLSGTTGYVMYAVCAAGFAFGVIWRSRIPARAPGESFDGFWRTNLPRAFGLYALLEGVAVLGAIVSLLSGQQYTAMAVMLVYGGIMSAFSPARLAGE
ncbi:MAG: hypothetical protein E4H38_05705 [Gemmatimonadales bacterium]|nr:MAG: hypothetical protein E4H38_05705 [Gemmatimonadales bacterium]